MAGPLAAGVVDVERHPELADEGSGDDGRPGHGAGHTHVVFDVVRREADDVLGADGEGTQRNPKLLRSDIQARRRVVEAPSAGLVAQRQGNARVGRHFHGLWDVPVRGGEGQCRLVQLQIGALVPRDCHRDFVRRLAEQTHRIARRTCACQVHGQQVRAQHQLVGRLRRRDLDCGGPTETCRVPRRDPVCIGGFWRNRPVGVGGVGSAGVNSIIVKTFGGSVSTLRRDIW